MTTFDTTPATSKRMRSIPSHDTSIEITVRKALFHLGYRFRLHDKSLPCTPDIVLKKHQSVIFVNGCFWHGHRQCQKGRLKPHKNADFWQTKLSNNVKRDKACIRKLKQMGWKVLVIWECKINNIEEILRGFFANDEK